MTLRAKVIVKVTMTFSTKKLIIRQYLRLEPLNIDVMWSCPVDDPNGKGQGQSDL